MGDKPVEVRVLSRPRLPRGPRQLGVCCANSSPDTTLGFESCPVALTVASRARQLGVCCANSSPDTTLRFESCPIRTTSVSAFGQETKLRVEIGLQRRSVIEPPPSCRRLSCLDRSGPGHGAAARSRPRRRPPPALVNMAIPALVDVRGRSGSQTPSLRSVNNTNAGQAARLFPAERGWFRASGTPTPLPCRRHPVRTRFP